MELLRCANCLAVYGDVQDRCPTCGADHEGERPEVVEFDAYARAAINSLGGIFGGILPGEDGEHFVWCERGVCRYTETEGFLWKANLFGRVDSVRVAEAEVVAEVGRRSWRLDREHGEELE